jgi:hypothetical protein
VNGVVVTKNLYRPDYPGMIINVQLGDVSTVSPPPGTQCEQMIVTDAALMNPLHSGPAIKYICHSSLHPRGPLMNLEQVGRLQKSVAAVKKYYAARGLEWDLEFKFDKGKLYLKQVRPFR